jgi:oligopeptide transport system substrate-binding protein
MARGRVFVAAAMTACAALLIAASGTAHSVREGGTLRVAVLYGSFSGIDPGLDNPSTPLLAPTCGALMGYPDKPLPAGFRLRPDLAEAEPRVSRDGRNYTFTIRRDARFSTGESVTAAAFAHALERILNPVMRSSLAGRFLDIVGAEDVLAGRATTLAGVSGRGRRLTLRLAKRVRDFLDRLSGLCAVPVNLPTDPEGAKAPLAGAGPYYVAEYVPNERLVLKRNRFYRGKRSHHLEQIRADLAVDGSQAVDQVARGTFDTVLNPAPVVQRAMELSGRYGVNKSQFFVQPGAGVRLFHLNVSRPLFKNNVQLRRAVNFAVDRGALAREAGPLAETPIDHYLLPRTAGYRNVRIYPLNGPDLRRARALARGHTRSRKAVLYTTSSLTDVAMAQILQRNLKAIGIELEVKQLPGNLFDRLATPGEPFDLGRVRWFVGPDPSYLNFLFDGRTIGHPGFGNYSYFDSPKYNRLLERASRLSGSQRSRAYAVLDVQLARDAAPAIPVSIVNALAFVSPRVGCVVMNVFLDLSALCLKR